MAENEYLDSTKARRWQSVVQVIRDGGSVEEVAESVEECFFKTLRQIRKDLPLADMIRAMENPDELMRVCQLVDGGEDVKDFIRQAALDNQIDSLAETDAGRLPVSISKHLYQTDMVERGGFTEVYVELYRKYRREWLAFVTKAKLNGCQWANLIDLPQKAA